MYIAPFVHELKAFFDATYDDGGGNLTLCHEIQGYYAKHGHSTKVKAAGLLSVEEAKALAGVTSMTVAPDLLRVLATTMIHTEEVEKLSLFREGNVSEEHKLARKTYVNDEKGWREAYRKEYDGKGLWKTDEAINVFREYQLKAEQLIVDTEKGYQIEGSR